MSRAIIEVRNLSKRYRLGAIGATSLREETSRLWDRLRGVPHPDKQEFWALRDVSFDVQPGEVVGVIGRNGAGKSTLLKILSRITEPTSGSARLRGRVASLLEVGTGFHPELTGRENVFLNGAILGMTRTEVRQKFDEIVAFAEVDQFIDTPVKRYSSGMYVRLAFAVAAHLEPDILIIDEVLAVGDGAFQRKCLGKMQEVSVNQGRTVLFVSHQMPAVANLCNRCLLIESGRIEKNGAVDDIIRAYNHASHQQISVKLAQRLDRIGNKTLRFVDAHFCTSRDRNDPCWISGRPGFLILRFENTIGSNLSKVKISVGLDNAQGQRVLLLSSEMTGDLQQPIPADVCEIEIQLDDVPLAPGEFIYTLYATVRGEVADWLQQAGSFTVQPGDFYGTGRLVPHGQGNFLVRHHFAIVDRKISR